MLPFYLFTLFATVQGQNRPLPGCCSFESSTCGYTSDPDFTSWTLNKDGSFISVDTGLEYQNSQEKRPEGEERSSCAGRERASTGHCGSTQTASDSWLISSIDLQNTTEPYRIVIDGRPGESTGSSVAIFEIRISSGYCLECNYEESHLCGYRNQWNTNINCTGRGEERGNLFSVYTRDQAGQYQDLGRSDPEDQNLNDWTNTTSEWIPVQVDIKAPHPLQVVFEVAFNSPRGGQVALDDITFFLPSSVVQRQVEPTFDPSIANCDFEGGFCRYTQDQKEGSPWKRVSVKPNIYRTGDHTTGAGSFLLAHSRLNPRAGYISRLLGPLLPGNMKYCLRFHYSLHGFIQTDQALTVYLQDQSGITQERIWTQNDKSRGVWIATEITFQSPHVANVVFVSTCTNFWDCGSVALDDISVSLGDCDLTTGLLLSVPGHCNFETGHCGYIQDKEGDKGDWVLVRGPTPTSCTGPRGDHTTGVGYYMHIEASNMLPGQNARLFSSPLRGSRCPQCLRFFYHMYGSGTGELSIHLRKDGKDELLWKRTGEQSITWLRATVEYRSDQQHQIVFEAIRGSSIRSDIAIDNIVFESGPCPDIEVKMTHSSGNSNDIE
ncbi:hypothetical protein J4Q44_G00240310 [Coregonus suidteri]|uniref:MAM domain-containing protein n=1 Tax=Coregonus suidteri TaxID=861788 RepID=A0AAN8LPE5_9TELE